MPSNFPPTSAPVCEKWERLPDKYHITEGPIFADGNRDTFIATPTPTRSWSTVFRGLTLAEAAILDNWHAANLGGHLSYTFTDRDSTVYAGVKCTDYERGHEGPYEYGQFRRITHEKKP